MKRWGKFGSVISCFITGTALVLAVPGVAVQASGFPEIGPLPLKEVPKESLAKMGQRLFFDVRVSGDGAISCATCHDPAQGFTRQVGKEGKPMALSDAYPGTRHFRNAPTLINVVYKADFADTGWGGTVTWALT